MWHSLVFMFPGTMSGCHTAETAFWNRKLSVERAIMLLIKNNLFFGIRVEIFPFPPTTLMDRCRGARQCVCVCVCFARVTEKCRRPQCVAWPEGPGQNQCSDLTWKICSPLMARRWAGLAAGAPYTLECMFTKKNKVTYIFSLMKRRMLFWCGHWNLNTGRSPNWKCLLLPPPRTGLNVVGYLAGADQSLGMNLGRVGVV